MALWLYALAAEPPATAPGLPGAAGEPPRVVPGVAGLTVVVGEVDTPPAASEATLRAHDAVVRALAAAADPVLPVRFGQWVGDEAELARLLAPRAAALRDALRQVAGCQQMTLRVLAPAPPPAAEPPPAPAEPSGPGTRYLLARRRELASPPRIAPLLARLAPLVRAERLAPAPRPYAATVYHLVERRRLAAYLATLAAAADDDPHLAWSGPWPPWAFAPELAG
jgi:hypothetical protein